MVPKITRIEMFKCMNWMVKRSGEAKAVEVEVSELVKEIDKDLKISMSEATARRCMNELGISWGGARGKSNTRYMALVERVSKLEIYVHEVCGYPLE